MFVQENETETTFMMVTVKSSVHLRNHKLLTLFLSLKKVDIQRSLKRTKYLFEIVQVRGKIGVQEEPLELNSEMCSLELCNLEELEYIWKGPTQNLNLHRLTTVTLRKCPKLRNIFTLTVVISLPELRRLYVDGCEEWEGIFCEESLQNLSSSSIVCFPRLESIEICRCDKVRRVFSYSMASHCPSLKTLYILDCCELERLVDEEAAHEDRLPLLKLKYLTLRCLPKLKEIFGECPQHKNENKVMDSELCTLKLCDLSELEYVWRGPTQNLNLHRLESVIFEHCPKLRNIFTLTVLRSLPELRTLKVNNCEEWEGIFCEESLQNLSFSSSIVCFPILESIRICICDKVRRLFSYSLASHCPSLEYITIENCSQLEGIVQTYEGEKATHHEKLFPKLNDLNLERLPKLREIYPYYEFIPRIMQIRDCPNISDLEIILES